MTLQGVWKERKETWARQAQALCGQAQGRRHSLSLGSGPRSPRAAGSGGRRDLVESREAGRQPRSPQGERRPVLWKDFLSLDGSAVLVTFFGNRRFTEIDGAILGDQRRGATRGWVR